MQLIVIWQKNPHQVTQNEKYIHFSTNTNKYQSTLTKFCCFCQILPSPASCETQSYNWFRNIGQNKLLILLFWLMTKKKVFIYSMSKKSHLINVVANLFFILKAIFFIYMTRTFHCECLLINCVNTF